MIRVPRVNQEGATLIEAIGGENFKKRVIHHSRCYQGVVKSCEYWALLLMALAKAISEYGIPEGWGGTNSLEEDWQGKILRSWSSSEPCERNWEGMGHRVWRHWFLAKKKKKNVGKSSRPEQSLWGIGKRGHCIIPLWRVLISLYRQEGASGFGPPGVGQCVSRSWIEGVCGGLALVPNTWT